MIVAVDALQILNRGTDRRRRLQFESENDSDKHIVNPVTVTAVVSDAVQKTVPTLNA